MKAFVQGLFLCCEERKNDEGIVRYVKLLSENDSIRIKFEDDTLNKFESCKKLKRMDEVMLPCSVSAFNSNLYYKALPD